MSARDCRHPTDTHGLNSVVTSIGQSSSSVAPIQNARPRQAGSRGGSAAFIGSASRSAAARRGARRPAVPGSAVELALVLRIEPAELVATHLRCRAIEHDRAVAQSDDAIETRQRDVDLMHRGQQRDAALASDGGQCGDGLFGACRIESRQRLVDQPQTRRREQCAGESDPLALAAGEAVDSREQFVGQAEAIERRMHVADVQRMQQRAQTFREPPRGQPTGQHGGDDALARGQRRRLRCHEDAAALALQRARAPCPRVDAGERHFAAGRPQRRSGDLQQGRLAGARRADDREPLAGSNGQVHPAQGRCVRECGRISGVDGFETNVHVRVRAGRRFWRRLRCPGSSRRASARSASRVAARGSRVPPASLCRGRGRPGRASCARRRASRR